MCGMWTKRSLLSCQYLRLHEGPSEGTKVDSGVRGSARSCLWIKEVLFLFISFKKGSKNISVYFELIGPQASRSPSCRISRVTRRSTLYFITPSKGMRGLISLGLTLRLLWETLSDQILRPQHTPIIRIIASHGNKERRRWNSIKHLNLCISFTWILVLICTDKGLNYNEWLSIDLRLSFIYVWNWDEGCGRERVGEGWSERWLG